MNRIKLFGEKCENIVTLACSKWGDLKENESRRHIIVTIHFLGISLICQKKDYHKAPPERNKYGRSKRS